MVFIKSYDGFVHLIVFIIMAHSALYFIYVDSLQRNQRENNGSNGGRRSEPTSQAASRRFKFFKGAPIVGQQERIFKYFNTNKLSKFMSYYNNLMLFLYALITLKYIVLASLNLNLLKEYRFFDCYLPGRFTIDAKTVIASKYLIISFLAANLINKLILVHRRPQFRFDFLEFIMKDFDGVCRWEEKTMTAIDEQYLRRRSQIWIHIMRFIRPKKWNQQNPLFERSIAKQSIPLNSVSHCEAGQESIIVFKNSYCNEIKSNQIKSNQIQPQEQQVIVRLNRYSWTLTFMTIGTIMYVMCILFTLILFLGFINIIAISISFTRQGFELNYYWCASWVQDQLAQAGDKHQTHKLWGFIELESIYVPRRIYNGTSSLASIFDTVHELPLVLPLKDLQPFSLFNIWRSLFDFLENNFIWYDLFMSFFMHYVIMSGNSVDIIINSREIIGRLSQLIDEASRDTYQQSQGLPLEVHSFNHNIYIKRPTFNNDDIATIQAIIIDHFTLLNDYNRHVRLCAVVGISIWFTYTVIVCGWMSFLVDGTSVSSEFYLIQFLATYLVIVGMVFLSWCRSCNGELYNMITNVMALDRSNLANKRRWHAILGYYFPTARYCYTVFDGIEVSYLLMLKLVTWIVSALVVFISLVTESRHKKWKHQYG